MDNIDKKIKELLDRKYSFRKIAKELQIAKSTIWKRCHKNGWKSPFHTHKKNYITHRDLLEYINKGFSAKEIGIQLNISLTSVNYYLKKYNLKTLKAQRKKLRDNIGYLCGYCSTTNKEDFTSSSNSVCKKCRSTQQNLRGKNNKDKILDYLGNCCNICNYNKYTSALEIHHKIPTIKDPNFTNIKRWSWKKIKNELDTCVLLCSNCHQALHSGELIYKF